MIKMANSEKQRTNKSSFTEKRPSVEKIRTYPISSSGPFYVYIKKQQDPLRLLPLADDLNQRYRSVEEIRSENPMKIRVSLTNRHEANGLVNDKYFRKTHHVFIPPHLVEVDGVVYADDITPSTMKDKGIGKFNDPRLKPVNIKFCSRLAKFSKTEECYLPSSGLRITFYGTVLPDFVQYQNIVLPIRPYFPKVMYCTNCKQYGHTVKHCSNSARCCKCMGNHTEADCSETHNCCFRCGQYHQIISNCPIFIAKTNTVKRNLKKLYKHAYNEATKQLPAEPNSAAKTLLQPNHIEHVTTNTAADSEPISTNLSRKPKKASQSRSSTSAPRTTNNAGLISFDKLIDVLCCSFDVDQHWRAFLQLIMPQLKYLMNDVVKRYPLVSAFITI